ncbi:hypothetical protein LTR27_007438 [Elasticomyces elasticus]|nr:hypothetical protein LTR27_007438 [Elasticomyces elasticus]
MIDTKTGIEVTIRPSQSGEPFREYASSQGPTKKSGSKSESYIEAVTDQEFGVLVQLKPNFDYKGCSHAKIDLDIDNLHTSWCVRRPDKGDGRSEWMSKTRRMVDGEYRRRGFSFGEVLPDCSVDLSTEEEDSEADKRGKIIVTVIRGSSITQKRQTAPPNGTSDMTMTSSKRVAVDKGKSHTLKSVDLGPAEIHTTTSVFTAAKGAKGKEINFKFFYVSRMILELKGIVPVEMRPPTQWSPPLPILDSPREAPATTQQDVEDAVVAEVPFHDSRLDMTADLPNHTSTIDKTTPKPATAAPKRSRAVVSSASKYNGKSTQICLEDDSNEPRPTCHDDQDDEEITPLPAQNCPDPDDEELIVVSAQETRRTKIKRETQDTIDITADEPAAKKVKREVIDITDDEVADKKVKMEAGGSMGRRSSSAATFSTIKSEFAGGRSAKARQKAKLLLDLEANRIKRQLMDLED